MNTAKELIEKAIRAIEDVEAATARDVTQMYSAVTLLEQALHSLDGVNADKCKSCVWDGKSCKTMLDAYRNGAKTFFRVDKCINYKSKGDK